jgi:3',5'-cyclic AMP phosphodiesterase CpdA
VENWFETIWRQTLDLANTRTFSLSGNHDMYSGGAAYYKLIDRLGQPASYFALQNDYWQFLAMDTGLHDSQPGGGLTFLEATEIDWLRDKLDNAGGRASVLLSHHPLFTSSTEPIAGKSLNEILYSQIAPLLPAATAWFWGHEHDLAIYKNYYGVLARCLGCGGLPVGLDERPAKPSFPEVPRENVRLGSKSAFYNRGYAIIDLDGPSALVSYYEDVREDMPLYSETLTGNR